MTRSQHSPEETALFRRAASGDKAAMNEIVSRNGGLVINAATYYASRNPLLSIDDLKQCGYMGLVRAIQKFDVDRGFRFSTYAITWVRQPIQRFVVANHGTGLSAGKKDTEAYMHGSATPEMIALYDLRCFYSVSLDAKFAHRRIDSVADVVPNDEEAIDETVERRLIAQKLRRDLHLIASDRDIWVMTEYYGLFGRRPRTMSEVGADLGISGQAVKKIIDKVVAAMREVYGIEEAG